MKLYKDTITIEEIEELLRFLVGFDMANNGVVFVSIQPSLKYYNGYIFNSYKELLNDIKEGKLTKRMVEYIISDLHTFDHENREILMYSFDRDKRYWEKHSSYKSNVYGVYSHGQWNT